MDIGKLRRGKMKEENFKNQCFKYEKGRNLINFFSVFFFADSDKKYERITVFNGYFIETNAKVISV